jgi:hypothetical protein
MNNFSLNSYILGISSNLLCSRKNLDKKKVLE